ncbi:TPA: fimbrial biogenesis outer membrane usher protein [Pseudomonas putida]|nr:fimbrial biogenesis outer membrane usher protein [Pseudomonas putida]
MQGNFSHQPTPLAAAVGVRSVRLPATMGCCLLYGALLLCGSVSAMAQEATTDKLDSNSLQVAEFNSIFFDRGGSVPSVDVKRFEKGTPVEPGVYRLDVYVNESWVGRMPISAVVEGTGKAAITKYCLKSSQFAELGVDLEKLPPQQQALVVGDCVDFAAAVPSGKLDVDLSELTAKVSVPQLYMGNRVRGYVNPSDWDGGVTAGFMMYNANLYRNENDFADSSNFYGSVNAGVNLDEWRLRYNGNYSNSKNDGTQSQSNYNSISTYAQHDVTRLKSQFTVGQYYTDSAVFDSVPFTGVQLASDDRMLPDSQRGFAPNIRGVADTNAKVQVKQGSNVIYETTVAPGPFELNDLYNTGYSGDLTVVIKEADGREKSFLVPFSSVNQLVRPGVSRYSITGGKYRDDQLEREPSFAQATYQYGVNNYVTAYTGGTIAEDYLSGQAGLAFSTPVGALAVDVTMSQAKGLDDTQTDGKRDMSGKSYRITYSKLLAATGTNMTLAAYRFNTEDYLSLQDFAQTWGSDHNNYNLYRQRDRFQLTLNQPVGTRSSAYFTGSKQDYWNKSSGDTSYQGGFNTGFSWGSMGVSASRTRDQDGEFDTTYMVNVTVPIGTESRHPMTLSSSLNFTDAKNNSVQTSLSGTALDNDQLSYSVYGSGDKLDGERSNNGGTTVSYSAPQAIYSANASTGDGYKQAGLGIRGSVVAHAGGINFSQNQSETMAIVEAKGAEGAAINNSVGAKVAGNGYAVVGGLTPYRQNDVELDPKGISKDVELQVTSQQVAPRYGSVVMLKYETVTGAPVLIEVKRDDGEVIPVGAEVLDAKGNSLSMVGQGGNIFLRGLEPQGEILIKWGDGSGQRCQVNYQLPKQADKNAPFLKMAATCRAVLEKTQVAKN